MVKIGQVYTYVATNTFGNGANSFGTDWFRNGCSYLVKDIDRNTVEITTEMVKTVFVGHKEFSENFELAKDQNLFDTLEVDKPILDKFGIEIKVGSYILYAARVHRVEAIEYKSDGTYFRCKLLSKNEVIETTSYIGATDKKISFSCVVFHPKIVDYLEYRGMTEDYESFVNDLDKVQSL